MTAMTCDRFDDRLSALMEGELPAADRQLMDAHADGCERCGPLLAELRGIVRDAAGMPELAPSRDLWAGIAARIEAPVVQLEPRQATAVVRRGLSWRAAAAAAGVLVALTALGTWQLAGRGAVSSGEPRVATTIDAPIAPVPVADPTADTALSVAPAPENAPAPAPVRPRAPAVAAPDVRNVASADAVTALYDGEIASLRRMLDTRRTELDTATVRVLEENLAIIDRAIEQSRQALVRDPNSTFLVDHLNTALGRKVQLLRTVTLLPASS